MISSFKKLLAERYLLRTFQRTISSSETASQVTFLSAKNCKNILSENVRDFFSPVVNLLGDVLIKKSVAVWQRRTEILRTG